MILELSNKEVETIEVALVIAGSKVGAKDYSFVDLFSKINAIASAYGIKFANQGEINEQVNTTK